MNEDRARAVGAGRVGGRTFMPRTDVPVTIGRLVCWRAGASAAVAPGYNNMMQKTRARRGKIFWPSTISDAYARVSREDGPCLLGMPSFLQAAS